MKDELKYPRVFALLEMRKEAWVNYNRFDEILGYVVSPCYLVKEHLSYDKDGTSSKKYEVVFPRSADSIYYNFFDRDNVPEYNEFDGYTNTFVVDFITLDYEEAIEKRNEVISNKVFNGVNLFLSSEPMETFNKRCDEYMEKIEKYQQRLNEAEPIEQVKKKTKTSTTR